MTRLSRWWTLCLPVMLALTLAFAAPAHAVTPDEVLDDPVLEERAREISKGLRCPVCQNESIDESNASVAGDLRVLVRERLLEGDSNQDVVDYIVARYGEFVLLKPQTGGANILLWAAGPLMLLLAGGVGIAYLRRRAHASTASEAALSEAEEDRLRALLDE